MRRGAGGPDQRLARPSSPGLAADDRGRDAEPAGRLSREPVPPEHAGPALARRIGRRDPGARASARSGSAGRTSTPCSKPTTATPAPRRPAVLDRPAELFVWRAARPRAPARRARPPRPRPRRRPRPRAPRPRRTRSRSRPRRPPTARASPSSRRRPTTCGRRSAGRGRRSPRASPRVRRPVGDRLRRAGGVGRRAGRVPLPGPGVAVARACSASWRCISPRCSTPSRRSTPRSRGADVRRSARAVFPPPAFDDGEVERQKAALASPEVAQPAIGAASVGLLDLLSSSRARARRARRPQLRRVRRAPRGGRLLARRAGRTLRGARPVPARRRRAKSRARWSPSRPGRRRSRPLIAGRRRASSSRTSTGRRRRSFPGRGTGSTRVVGEGQRARASGAGACRSPAGSIRRSSPAARAPLVELASRLVDAGPGPAGVLERRPPPLSRPDPERSPRSSATT